MYRRNTKTRLLETASLSSSCFVRCRNIKKRTRWKKRFCPLISMFVWRQGVKRSTAQLGWKRSTCEVLVIFVTLWRECCVNREAWMTWTWGGKRKAECAGETGEELKVGGWKVCYCRYCRYCCSISFICKFSSTKFSAWKPKQSAHVYRRLQVSSALLQYWHRTGQSELFIYEGAGLRKYETESQTYLCFLLLVRFIKWI